MSNFHRRTTGDPTGILAALKDDISDVWNEDGALAVTDTRDTDATMVDDEEPPVWVDTPAAGTPTRVVPRRQRRAASAHWQPGMAVPPGYQVVNDVLMSKSRGLFLPGEVPDVKATPQLPRRMNVLDAAPDTRAGWRYTLLIGTLLVATWCVGIGVGKVWRSEDKVSPTTVVVAPQVPVVPPVVPPAPSAHLAYDMQAEVHERVYTDMQVVLADHRQLADVVARLRQDLDAQRRQAAPMPDAVPSPVVEAPTPVHVATPRTRVVFVHAPPTQEVPVSDLGPVVMRVPKPVRTSDKAEVVQGTTGQKTAPEALGPVVMRVQKRRPRR